MKKIKYLFALALTFAALLILISCAKDPYEYTWYIDSYTKDGATHTVLPPDRTLNHFAVCTTDTVKLDFGKDKTFAFTDYSGTEHRGTYETNKEKRSVAYEITMTFENGETAIAKCTSPTGNESMLEVSISGVDYTFYNIREREYTKSDFSTDIKNTAIAVRDASLADIDVTEKNGIYYYKGIIEEREGKFYLTYADNEYNLTDTSAVYAYYIDEKDSLTKKDSLSAGECVIRERRGEYAVYYLSSNASYIREEVSFGEIYGWLNELTLYDIDEIAYVFDKGSIAPGHLQEARIASFAECEAIISYLDNTKLTYVAPENVKETEEGAPIDFVIITSLGVSHKLNLCQYHYLNGHAYAPSFSMPDIADRNTNYVNIDTHLIHKEIFSFGQKISNTDVDLSYLILEAVDSYDGVDLDFTTDCIHVSDISVNVIDAKHIQYAGIIYTVVGEYDLSGCFSDTNSDSFSILTIKDGSSKNVIMTIKYDTGAALSASDILNLLSEDYAEAKLYCDEALSEELTSVDLTSNYFIYVS